MVHAIEDSYTEDTLQNRLEQYFELHGWTAIREVSPHNANVRADLIVNHDEYGWFGIETKFFDGDGGSKAADAHHQIVSKYRGKRYIRNKINLWAICPFFSGRNSNDEWHQQRANQRNQFTRELFCRHGVGYINPFREPLLIDFAYSRAECKVPVNTNRDTRHHDNVDVELIREAVSRKMDKYDY